MLNRLSGMPRPLRVAFAGLCAERLLPAYVRFSEEARRGNPGELAGILDHLWTDIEAGAVVPADIDSRLEKSMALVPGEDDVPWVESQAAGEDAAEALVYALRCCKTGDGQDAAWAAECVYEALDNFVINELNLDMNSPGAGDHVLSHPLMQAELARQQRDLEELSATDGQLTAEVVRCLRARAREEAKILFGDNG